MVPTNNLNYLLQHIADVMTKQTDQVLQEQLGIGLSQFKLLMVLEWSPRIQQRSIASALGQTEASISRQIKLLKSKGLLDTKLDPNNRRKHITAPSTLGMQVTEAASSIIRRTFGVEFNSFGDEQMMQLFASLQRLHKITCRAGKVGACDHMLGI